jgi:hypothetical protein
MRNPTLGMALTALACACSPAQTPESPLPAFVAVEFRGALIAPTKVNGAPWDGPGPLDASAATLIAKALAGADPYDAALSVLANPAIAALDKPEPFGDARVMNAGAVLLHVPLQTSERDTLTPIWNSATAPRVPLAPSTRIEITLLDKDLEFDDAMGVATVTESDLVAALRAGTVYHVPLAEQTHNQVLFLDLSVYAAR